MSDPVMLERERCLRLVEARIRRLDETAARYPVMHPHRGRIAAVVSNLMTVNNWIAAGLSETDVMRRNPGGTPNPSGPMPTTAEETS